MNLLEGRIKIMDSKHEILTEFTSQKNLLEIQIEELNSKILSLQKHIIALERANSVLEQLAVSEKDSSQKSRYYGAIRNNTELLARLYAVIKEFEDVKFKYYKEIDDVLYNKFKLVAIEIRKLEDKIGDEYNFMNFFEKLGDVLSKNKTGIESETQPEYRL